MVIEQLAALMGDLQFLTLEELETHITGREESIEAEYKKGQRELAVLRAIRDSLIATETKSEPTTTRSSNGYKSGASKKVLDFLRLQDFPKSARDIAVAIDVERKRVHTALTYLQKTNKVVRQDDGWVSCPIVIGEGQNEKDLRPV